MTVKLNRLLADGDMVVALTEVTVGDQEAKTPTYSPFATATRFEYRCTQTRR